LTVVLDKLYYDAALRFFQTPQFKFRTQKAPRMYICLQCFNCSGKRNFCRMKTNLCVLCILTRWIQICH
jgi:hypothetical protein